MKIFNSQGSYNLLPPAALNLALPDTVNANGEKIVLFDRRDDKSNRVLMV